MPRGRSKNLRARSSQRDLIQLRKSGMAHQELPVELVSSLFEDPAKYEPYLEGLIDKLAKRERRLGRYNPYTSLGYSSLGDAYRKLKDPRAIAMYRSEYRIQTILYGCKTNGPISGIFLQVLQGRHLSDSAILGIQQDIDDSIQNELEGDWFRRYGKRQDALIKYHAAARIEESSFGRDNPDLTFLWRKMACLSAINKRLDSHDEVNLLLDFEKADRIGSEWMKGAHKFLSSGLCSIIRKGDEYFGMLLYSQAVGEYFKASSGALVAVSQYHRIEPGPSTSATIQKPRPKETPANNQSSLMQSTTIETKTRNRTSRSRRRW